MVNAGVHFNLVKVAVQEQKTPVRSTVMVSLSNLPINLSRESVKESAFSKKSVFRV